MGSSPKTRSQQMGGDKDNASSQSSAPSLITHSNQAGFLTLTSDSLSHSKKKRERYRELWNVPNPDSFLNSPGASSLF